MFTGRRTAELIKYAANAFLATKITFINEIADLAERSVPTCRKSRAELDSTTESAPSFSTQARLWRLLLSKGHAWLIKTAQDYESPIRVVETVLAVNENRKRAMARKVASIIDGSLRGKTIALLGLTFKPNTDDIRESPSIPLVTALQDLAQRSERMIPKECNKPAPSWRTWSIAMNRTIAPKVRMLW
jgi:UDPglucose 6-dehydrogenase